MKKPVAFRVSRFKAWAITSGRDRICWMRTQPAIFARREYAANWQDDVVEVEVVVRAVKRATKKEK